ncbi:hypothetical protein FPCIR_3165 [Fusarium pseudocircinatum]|uniref:Uncharacterized protein n=1 Tax=Fusarium pseudocircinatum TaxID=56676 RepID=A0A8H5PKW9_9HYPO|nr:hypothetical protein FPCIR_3165 [Fusarium pseudocircinatum]
MIAAFRHAWNYSRLGTFKQTFLYHKAQTIRLVNEQLRPSAFVPFCADHIVTLCFSECTFGNFEAAETHLMGMLSYMETRGNPKDEQDAIAHEICERYFIVAYNMIQGLKSRVDDYLASPAGAAFNSRCQLSPQELEQLIPEWHSFEANGAGLCLEAMSLLPSFFASSAVCPKLNPVNPSRVISCLKGITRIFEMRSSCKRGISHDTSLYELWDHGDPSRLFSAVVEAHIESCSPVSAVTNGPRAFLQSSWTGIIVTSGMYLNSVLGVWNSGQPEQDQLLHYILRSSFQDLKTCFAGSDMHSPLSRDLIFWKLFVSAFHLTRARLGGCNALIDSLNLEFKSMIRVITKEMNMLSWQDARTRLAQIVWPKDFDREDVAKALWHETMADQVGGL